MSKTNVSLRFSLSFAFVIIVLITSLTLGLVTYFSVRVQLREGLRQRIGDVVASASLNIRAGEHAQLRTVIDMETDIYKNYRDQFAAMRSLNDEIGFLYTLRRLDEGKYQFVLDSGETEEDFSPLGMLYEETTPSLEAAFQKPYRIQVENEFYTDQWGTWLSSFAPILDENGELEAVIGLDISAGNVLAYERKLLVLLGEIFLFVSLMGAVAGIFISRRISMPLLGLAAEMGKIQQFNLETEVVSRSSIREVIIMADSLINMKKGLRSFKKYVPSDVVAQLISLNKEAVLETSKFPLTIFFSDLENFTGLSESLSPERLVEALGGYFQAITSTLQDHKATVDKFIGDSVMAFWNAPKQLEDHAYWACKAALSCQSALDRISSEWALKGIPAIRTRMGINSGMAVVGNIGYPDRLSYTALGDAVNIASRLESLNKFYGTSILIGEETFRAVEGRFLVRLVDRVTVKGKTKGTGIYELLSSGELPPPWAQLLDSYNGGLSAYFSRDWAKAKASFEAVLLMKPGDGPASLLLRKTAQFAVTPPPDSWDGSTVMHEK